MSTVVLRRTYGLQLTSVLAFIFQEKATEITFGYPPKKGARKMEDYGVMFYHRNRLIKPYVKLGCQARVHV